ncbi:ABC transporter substrate-binding protein [Microbacterium tumbae]
MKTAVHRSTGPGRRSGRGLLAAAALAVSTALVLSACSPSTEPTDDTSSVRIGIEGAGFSFAPTSQDRLATSMVYDFLVTQDESGYHPRAATLTYNEGNTVLTIELNEGLTFADDTPIDAEVVRANILWAKDNGAFFGAIESVEVTGDLTLEVTQSAADKNVMLSMWAMPIVSVDTLENPETYAENPNESGPYLYDEEASTSGATHVFTRNPDYPDAEMFPYDDVTISILEDVTSRVNALKSGQIDVAPIGSATAADAEAAGYTLNQLYSSAAGMILGDRRGDILPPLGDVRVRQAMNMAFDRQAMVDAIFAGYAKPSSQAFAEGTPGYQEDDADAYAYDPEGAMELLADAGYPDGFDLTLPTYEPITGDAEAYIKQALADIGIRVTFEAFNDDTWVPAFSGGEFPIATLGLPFAQAVDVASPDFFWNPWHNDDPEAVALLETINTGTPEEIVSATDALGKLQFDDAWWVIWAHPATIWASVEEVQVTTPQYSDWVTMDVITPAN